MSASAYRLLVLAANLLIFLGIVFLGVRAYRGSPADPAESPPSSFNPLAYELPMSRGNRSSLLEHRVTWQQLDRAKPVEVPISTGPRIDAPTVRALGEYTLVMALANPRDENSSSVILQGRAGTVTLKVGEKLADGFEVISVVVRGKGDEREAIVIVASGGKTQEIRYRRSQSK